MYKIRTQIWQLKFKKSLNDYRQQCFNKPYQKLGVNTKTYTLSLLSILHNILYYRRFNNIVAERSCCTTSRQSNIRPVASYWFFIFEHQCWQDNHLVGFTSIQIITNEINCNLIIHVMALYYNISEWFIF